MEHCTSKHRSYVTQIWDDELASMAAAWAGRCVYRHGQPPNTSRHPGQNLFGQYGRSELDLASATQSWYDEVKDYNYDSNTCGKVCGHYTQVGSVTLS